MRRALLSRALPVRQTRTAEQALLELRQAPRSVLIVELAKRSAPAVLALLEIVDRRFPHARTLAVTARGMEGYEPLLRELGAVHVEHSARDGTALVDLAHLHLSRLRPTTTTGRLTGNPGQPLPWGD